MFNSIKMEKEFDIIILGATGFTGGLVAAYFANKVDNRKVKWAIAGRNLDKLEAVKGKLEAINPDCSLVGLIVADTADNISLRKMASKGKILISTVGPFIHYGLPVVEACINEGTHYLDITGEPAFVTKILKDYDALAKEKGVLVINCCGFDSIPADLGAFYTAKQFNREENVNIKGYVFSNATFSGGTWASAINAFAQGKKGMERSGAKTEKSKKEGFNILKLVQYIPEIKKYALPMPVIDPWMVGRTAKTRKDIFGNGFVYNQFISLPDLKSVIGLLGGLGIIVLGAQFKPTRDLLLNYRKSGEGPDKEKRDKSFFKLTFIGKSSSKTIITTVSGGDPGYTETSKMLSESALTLFANYDKLAVQSGVTTPAAALGDFLVDVLIDNGIKFEIK